MSSRRRNVISWIKENKTRYYFVFIPREHQKLVIVIEAKSVSASVLQKDITRQLESYLDPTNFPLDANVPKIGVTLTKYKVLHPPENGFVSLTWTDIIELINDVISLEKRKCEDVTIATEFIDFIIGVRKGMKYYEVEVLSVAAGKTYELTKNYFVHACPHTAKGFHIKLQYT